MVSWLLIKCISLHGKITTETVCVSSTVLFQIKEHDLALVISVYLKAVYEINVSN